MPLLGLQDQNPPDAEGDGGAKAGGQEVLAFSLRDVSKLEGVHEGDVFTACGCSVLDLEALVKKDVLQYVHKLLLLMQLHHSTYSPPPKLFSVAEHQKFV